MIEVGPRPKYSFTQRAACGGQLQVGLRRILRIAVSRSRQLLAMVAMNRSQPVDPRGEDVPYPNAVDATNCRPSKAKIGICACPVMDPPTSHVRPIKKRRIRIRVGRLPILRVVG